jgi:hypothetical protein
MAAKMSLKRCQQMIIAGPSVDLIITINMGSLMTKLHAMLTYFMADPPNPDYFNLSAQNSLNCRPRSKSDTTHLNLNTEVKNLQARRPTADSIKWFVTQSSSHVSSSKPEITELRDLRIRPGERNVQCGGMGVASTATEGQTAVHVILSRSFTARAHTHFQTVLSKSRQIL